MAAYRSCSRIENQRTGEIADYTRKTPALHTEIVLPINAPQWAEDRAALWNRSETAHRRADSVIARELEIGMPHELPQAQRQAVGLEFARYVSDRFNVAVDVCFHPPNRQGDQRNFHAHLLVCTRTFDETKKTGFGNNVRELDAVAQKRAGESPVVEELRQQWQDMLNRAFEREGITTPDGLTVQVDHRSYARQGIEQEPTEKLGVAASALERRGEESERGQVNTDIRKRNAERERLQAQIAASEWELAAFTPRRAAVLTREQVDQELLPVTLSPRRAETLTAHQAGPSPANSNTVPTVAQGSRQEKITAMNKSTEPTSEPTFAEMVASIRKGEISPDQLPEFLPRMQKAQDREKLLAQERQQAKEQERQREQEIERFAEERRKMITEKGIDSELQRWMDVEP